MTRNNIIDFLQNQSSDKDKVLFGLLKDEEFNIPGIKIKKDPNLSADEIYKILEDPNLSIDEIHKMLKEAEPKPKFTNLSKCQECRYWDCEDKICASYVAKEKGCGYPEYKYFEER